MKYHLEDVPNIKLTLKKWSIVFLEGDLWAWKTTFVQNILKNHFWITDSVTSPTYTYYNKYENDIYHFDLYRLEKYDEFFAIGWEEVLDSWATCFIEWPGILRKYYTPDIEIHFKKCDDEMSRDISIIYKK